MNDDIIITIKRPPGGKFKVGDKVDYLGYAGDVIFTDSEFLLAEMDVVGQWGFYLDGRAFQHSYPILSFVSREKKKITKTIERWMNINIHVHFFYETKEEADEAACPTRIACVKLTGTYEVYED